MGNIRKAVFNCVSLKFFEVQFQTVFGRVDLKKCDFHTVSYGPKIALVPDYQSGTVPSSVLFTGHLV